MSDKINYSDLSKKIAKAVDSKPETVQNLKTQMGIVMREALEKDGSVHLKGLGTFYMKWSETREGINPKTGEKIEIPGHNHVSFRPDASVRRQVNKEFENLKAFILDDSGNKEPEAAPEPETKKPVWLYAAVVALLIAVIALLANPREVIMTEEVVVVEERVVMQEVPVLEEVIVVKEVPVIEEVIVVKEVPVVADAPEVSAAAAPPAPHLNDASDLLEDISEMPKVDPNVIAEAENAGQGPRGDQDILDVQAGVAIGEAYGAYADAKEAEAKALAAEGTIDAEKTDKKAAAADAEAMEAIAEAIDASKKARDNSAPIQP